jgi:peptidoglycan/LPS O-acetylase OafA/YrhL
VASSRCPGGFIGVDVFFVISGYLITGILARDLARDRFSLLGFYERRARRILPALGAVLLVCSVLCYFFFVHQDLVRYAESLLSAVLSYANLYFWTQSDYFQPTYVKVLLHTWSLAVEEQFYLVLPTVLMFMWRWPKAIRPAFFAATACSFGASAWLAYRHPESAFFMPFSRAWELLIGSVIALDCIRLPKSRALMEAATIIGAFMICFAAVEYSSKTPFPGIAALLPCLGSAMLLIAGERERTSVASVLSFPPIAFIGSISYSVYLWHWPLIIFAKIGALPGLTARGPLQIFLIVVLSLLLGALSWRFIEQPFRSGRWKTLPRSKIFGLATTMIGAFITIAAIYGFDKRLPTPFPSSAITVAKYLNIQPNLRIGTCFITSANHFRNYRADICTTTTDPHRNRNYFLIGDSHAAYLWSVLQGAMPDTNVMQATASGCAPLLGHYDLSDCGQMRQFIFANYLSRRSVDKVILTERWTGERDIDAIEPTVLWLKQRQIPVTAIGPVPEYNAPLPMLLAFAIRDNDPELPGRHRSEGLDPLDRELQVRAKRWGISYLSPFQEICPDRHCEEYVDQSRTVPTLVDDNHLSAEAASRLVLSWRSLGKLR